MQPFVLELDMAYARAVLEKQKTAIQKRDTAIQERDIAIQEKDVAIQRKNLKLASNLLKSGQLDGLTLEESVYLIMEEVEVDYDEALGLYDQLFQN